MLIQHEIYEFGPYVLDSAQMLLRRDIYATAAIAGVFLYLLIQKLGMARAWASIIAMLFIVALRLVSVACNWQLPVFALPPP